MFDGVYSPVLILLLFPLSLHLSFLTPLFLRLLGAMSRGWMWIVCDVKSLSLDCPRDCLLSSTPPAYPASDTRSDDIDQ